MNQGYLYWLKKLKGLLISIQINRYYKSLKISRIEIKRLAQSLAETLQENNDLAKENKRLNNEMQELIKHHE